MNSMVKDAENFDKIEKFAGRSGGHSNTIDSSYFSGFFNGFLISDSMINKKHIVLKKKNTFITL